MLQKIVLVYVDNQWIKTPYWQVGCIDVDNRYIQTTDHPKFRDALSTAKRYKVPVFLKTRDDDHPIDDDSQEVMDLLKYA